jgi:signal peptidase I
MLPSLSPGDVLLVSRRWFGRPRRGRLVVVGRGGVAVVKRVSAGPGDEAMPGWILGPDQWLVLGDNREASTDSRSFGAIGTSDISGQVLLRLPRRRTGRSPQVLHR